MNYSLIWLEYNVVDSRLGQDGYVYLRITKPSGRLKWIRRYKLVYEYYVEDRIKGMHIHHIDFNKRNDDWRNLVQITREEHAAIHGKVIDIATGVVPSRMTGKKHSEETKRKMSLSAMGNHNVPMFRSDHFKIAISAKQKNFGNSTARKDISIEEVLKLHAQGYGKCAMSKILGCSRQVIDNRLKWSKA